MKVGITGETSSDDNNNNNSTISTIIASVLSVLTVGVIIIIVVTVCVIRKKQKGRRYVSTSSNKHNVDHVDLSYRIGNIHAREMQSKTNSIIYENVENDKSEIKMSEDPNSMHTCETFKPHSPVQTDAVYDNPSAGDEEITKAKISNPASTFKPKARENPYVLDTSTENTSSTTT